ncbi:MAG: glycine C-acetyltransferase [Motilibacteraceae bacterium]
MRTDIYDDLGRELEQIRAAGLRKSERALATAQGVHVAAGGQKALNFCANNYLGLADDPSVVRAAHEALDRWGFGMASVRFICGTQELHHALERRLSEFLGTEETLLYSSCFDANGGVFEALFDERDAIISDALNHASLIDGIRLSKAARHRYANGDMVELERALQQAAGARRRVVVTDGVFSMDGSFAPLPEICRLADRYDALVMVDDSHATGFVGPTGRGTAELLGVQDRVDILTGTLGKALGGAAGGYVSAAARVIEMLRQRSRPYLFSNALPPAVVAGSLRALELVASAQDRRLRLGRNAELFRRLMTGAGFELLPGSHPIVPVMFRGDDGAAQASRLAAGLLDRGVFVTAFSYPVVPRGQARIRTQLSSAHTETDIRACVQAFVEARDSLS